MRSATSQICSRMGNAAGGGGGGGGECPSSPARCVQPPSSCRAINNARVQLKALNPRRACLLGAVALLARKVGQSVVPELRVTAGAGVAKALAGGDEAAPVARLHQHRRQLAVQPQVLPRVRWVGLDGWLGDCVWGTSTQEGAEPAEGYGLQDSQSFDQALSWPTERTCDPWATVPSRHRPANNHALDYKRHIVTSHCSSSPF